MLEIFEVYYYNYGSATAVPRKSQYFSKGVLDMAGLTAEQIEQFEAEGYLALGQVASDDQLAKLQQRLDDLNYMLRDRGIRIELRRRLRAFFFETKDIERVKSYTGNMPDPLATCGRIDP